MTNGILVIAEHRDGKVKAITKEALTLAGDLASKMGGDVVAAVLGDSTESFAPELAGFSAARVIRVEDGMLASYTPEAYVAALKQVIAAVQPKLVLTGHTYQAIDFFPRLAASLDAALIPDVTTVTVDGDRPVFTRKVLNGKLDAQCTPQTEGPWFASVQQGAFPAREPNGSSPDETMQVDLNGVTPRKVKSVEAAEKGTVDLTGADVVVAGGRGVGDKDKFKVVFDLAEVLEAAVGASRPPCDSEWVESERQIGSSGQVVAPKLYFAIGISGAIQHVVGMRGSQCTVAINKDPNAAIFQEATYGIVGDLHEIVPAITAAIAEAKQS